MEGLLVVAVIKSGVGESPRFSLAAKMPAIQKKGIDDKRRL